MKKLNVGQLCLLDPENIFKLTEDQIFTVKVVSCHGPFFDREYNCLNLSNGKIIYNISQKLLVPVQEYEMNDIHTVVRYPEDTPTITTNDINAVKQILDKSTSGDLTDRLNLLITKLKYFNNINRNSL